MIKYIYLLIVGLLLIPSCYKKKVLCNGIKGDLIGLTINDFIIKKYEHIYWDDSRGFMGDCGSKYIFHEINYNFVNESNKEPEFYNDIDKEKYRLNSIFISSRIINLTEYNSIVKALSNMQATAPIAMKYQISEGIEKDALVWYMENYKLILIYPKGKSGRYSIAILPLKHEYDKFLTK